jgi:hypothetical protein
MYWKRFTNLPTKVVGASLFLSSVLGQFASEADAGGFNYAGSSGPFSASVTFEQVGTNLKVTLANTSTVDVRAPSEVLTATFFTLAGDPTLTPVSAIVPGDSTVLFGGTGPGGSVGGEWAYKDHLSRAPLRADEGISSAGLNLFGSHDRFPGFNLQGPGSPGGLQYGITSCGDNPATGNRAVTGNNALIKDEVVFTFSGLPSNYVLTQSSVSKVYFQYGTGSCRDPEFPGQLIPEPSTWMLVGISLLMLLLLGRRAQRPRPVPVPVVARNASAHRPRKV